MDVEICGCVCGCACICGWGCECGFGCVGVCGCGLYMQMLKDVDCISGC